MYKKIILFSLLLASGVAVAQAPTPAGTQIVNQAVADYEIAGQAVQRTFSNPVATVVQEVCGVSVLANGSITKPAMTREVLPGETATYAYTVTNTGNFVATLPLSVTKEGGDTLTPTLTLHVDRNGNGRVDPEEPAVQSVTLDAGQAATVLVQAATVQAQPSGNAYINLVASCAAGDSRDADNVSLLVVGTPPTLQVDKVFDPELIRPGQETAVRVKTTNTSDRESREVVLTDLLADQIAQGLEFVANSAQTDAGRLEYFDGYVWTAVAPAEVRGVRTVVDRLAPGQELNLTFRLRAREAADGRSFINVASALTSGREVRDDATLQVRFNPGVAIGPMGNPLAPENTPADSQTQTYATAGGEQICFDHTLRNTGDAADAFTISVTFPVGQAGYTLVQSNGQLLVQPIELQPGQETTVRVCYTPQGSGVMEALLTVMGARGTSNTTRDALRPQPKLSKTVVSIKPEVEQGNTQLAKIGSEVTYQLQVTNTYGLPLTGVQLVDTLPAAVDYISSQPGGSVEGTVGNQRVIWNIGTLAPGGQASVEVTVRITDRAQMGETLSNTFELVSSELTTVSSPPASVQVPIKIQVTKKADQQEVNLGDRVRFTLNVTNPSPVATLKPVLVQDVLAFPETLEYIPDTSTIRYGNATAQPLENPDIKTQSFDVNFGGYKAGTPIPEVMAWTLPELQPQQTATITYEMRVEPGAAQRPQLQNFVLARGTGPGGATDIAEDTSDTAVILRLNAFKPIADLVGTVFVDRNRSGTYEKEIDTPVNRARVVLAGGRISLTDKDGRYSFLNVPLGTHAVRLDPGTTPYPPLVMPREGGLVGTQIVHLGGSIAALDFPLAPLGGDITVIRRTTVQADDLTLHKVVFSTAEGYVVNLYLDATKDIRQVRITDPLPQGATLSEGSAEFFGPLTAGQRLLSYRFSYEGEPRTAVTDPQVEWR